MSRPHAFRLPGACARLRAALRIPSRLLPCASTGRGAALRSLSLLLLGAAAGCVTVPERPVVPPEQRASARAELVRGAALAERDAKGARAALERAVALDPELWEAVYDLGVLAERAGELGAAEQRYAAAAAGKPSLRAARQNLAALQARRGAAREAARNAEALAAEGPPDARLLAQLALLHRAAGDTTAALEAARRALRASPESNAALAAAGLALADAGKPDLAELVLARARGDRARDPQLLLARGVVAARRGKYEDALALFRAAAERDGRWPAPRLYACRLLLEAGDSEGAVSEARAVLAARPDHAAAHLALGIGLRLRKDLPGAEAAYRKALVLDPGLAEASWALAVLYMDHLERGAEAKPLLERFLEARPRPESLDAEARARLAKLASP